LPELELMVASYGVSAHYNWAPFDDNLILGGELDITLGHESNETISFNEDGSDGIEFTNSWDTVISLRARAGMTNGKLHSYIAGGPAFANATFSVTDLDPAETEGCGEVLTCAEVTETLTGLSFGAGMEYAFRDDWVGKFEFVHYAMPTVRAPIFDGSTPTCGAADGDECTVSFDNSSTLVRFGVSYKF
jgi:opacity protein-like surface antigen